MPPSLRHQAALEGARRKAAARSLYEFCDYTHHDWQEGKHLKKICDALEAVERGEIRRLMIETPPRHAKSELCSRRFPAWYVGRNSNKQILCCTYGAEFATSFGQDVRNIIRSPAYQNVFPGTQLQEDAKAKGNWRTTNGGIYASVSLDGQVTGRGADLAIIDDPYKGRKEADSETIRDHIWRLYTSTFYTRLMPKGAIVLIGTRWHEDDLFSRALDSEEWTRINLPAIAHEDTDREEALWPERYPIEELHKVRQVMLPRDWQAIYQQRPTKADGEYMRRAWFEDRYNPEDLPPLNVFISSDPAVTPESEAKDPDYTEHAVVGVSPDRDLYVIDWWHGRTTADEWLRAMIDLVVKHKPMAWFCEAGVIRRAIEPLLKITQRERKSYFRTCWVPSIVSKEIRGRPLQALCSMGKVKFPRTPWADRVIEQLVAFPGAKHDDAFDALSLIARAIDEAHPAIVEKPKKPQRPRDYLPTNVESVASWRVA